MEAYSLALGRNLDALCQKLLSHFRQTNRVETRFSKDLDKLHGAYACINSINGSVMDVSTVGPQ